MSDTNRVKLPLLPLRDPELVVFPGLYCEIDVGRAFSVNAVKQAAKNKSRLIIGMQKNSTVDAPKAADFYGYCTEAEIKSELALDKEGTKLRIIIVGIRRAILKTVGNTAEYMHGEIEPAVEPEVEIDEEVQTLFKEMRDMIREQVQFIAVENDGVPANSSELSRFVDTVAGQLPISGKKRVKILSVFNPKDRMKLVAKELAKVANNVETEVGASDGGGMGEESAGNESLHGVANEIKKLKQRIDKSGMPPNVLKVAANEFRRLSMMSPSNSEFQVTYNYLEHLASLPWSKSTQDKIDVEEAKTILDEDHYGLKKPKERILEFLAVRKLKPERKGSILCFSGPPGVGKAQPLDAKVLTPNGFKLMGDVAIGDQVLTPSGDVANIIGIFPQGEKDIYRVGFSDNVVTECCKEHLWKVATRDDRRQNKIRITSLEDMVGNLYVENGTRKNYSIDTIINIDMNSEVELDPYVVGTLLSEGQCKKVIISNGDSDIIEEIERSLPDDCCLRKYSDYDYCIVKKDHNPANNINTSNNRSSVDDFIRNAGLKDCLSNNKFIPIEYKTSSFKNRERLLQGIFDGDGSPDGDSCAVEWSSASYIFAMDVMEVVQSLGGQAIYSRGEAFYTYKGEKLQGQDRHRLRIVLPSSVIPFLCRRKRNIYSENLGRKRDLKRYISDITFVGKKEAQCILIDHPDHLYITDNYIITHNTSLGKSIARATGREFIRISLGGVNDEAEIRGHRRTYVGAIPGRIMENIRKVGSKNPVFMLDEVDKLCANFRGDPSSALLEVLDPEQNNAFIDHYLSVPFDLSQVLFIGTVNEISPIAPALRDRLEIIEIPGYSPFDKVKIAQDYLVPKQKEENGLEDRDVIVTPKAINRIIDEYTSEAGVRSLERECGTVMRKLAVMLASGKEPPRFVKVDMIPKYLGPPKAFAEKAADKPEVGLSTGLAWSKYGGSVLFVETSLTPGEGKIKLTGNLGKVIQESATAAHTWIHANAASLKIPEETLKKYDVHIHFPAGAVPKDGPSAGIAVAASMLSVFTNRPVNNSIAMTGEITLRGRVLPIGGLKEKVLAAHRAGIKHVIFPMKNKHDLDEIPSDVLSDMEFSKVENLKEALDLLLLDKEEGEGSGDISPGSGEQLMNKEAL
jgi:ATP-dependent Lon protease